MAQHVPLIGQPMTVVNYTILVTVTCNCEQRGVLTLLAQFSGGQLRCAKEECPSCRRVFNVHNFSVDANGQMQFNVEMGVPQEVALSH